MADFVTVQKFLNVNSASLAKSVLEGNGIQCWLSDENLTVMAPHYGFFAGGIKLQVVPEDLERAQEILDEIEIEIEPDNEDRLPEDLEAYEDDAEADIPTDPERCPNCGSATIVMGETPQWIRLLGVILLLGLPLLFSTRRAWTCRDCGWEWTP